MSEQPDPCADCGNTYGAHYPGCHAKCNAEIERLRAISKDGMVQRLQDMGEAIGCPLGYDIFDWTQAELERLRADNLRRSIALAKHLRPEDIGMVRVTFAEHELPDWVDTVGLKLPDHWRFPDE